jgi:hypothetical protein
MEERKKKHAKDMNFRRRKKEVKTIFSYAGSNLLLHQRQNLKTSND